MGSSCRFAATPLGMAPLQTPKTHHAGTSMCQTLGPIKISSKSVLPGASCNIALTVLMALSLAQPFRSSSRVSYIFSLSWPLNISSLLQLHKQIKTQQSSKLKVSSALQLPSRKKKEKKKGNNQP
jgi:hypothetical protein